MDGERDIEEPRIQASKMKSKTKSKAKKKKLKLSPVKAVGQFSFFDPTQKPVEKMKAAPKKSKPSSLVVPKIVEDDEEIEELLVR